MRAAAFSVPGWTRVFQSYKHCEVGWAKDTAVAAVGPTGGCFEDGSGSGSSSPTLGVRAKGASVDKGGCDGRSMRQVSPRRLARVRASCHHVFPLRDLFRGLDRWIRMRIRCMKFKRKSRADNGRMRLQQFPSAWPLALSDLRPAPV